MSPERTSGLARPGYSRGFGLPFALFILVVLSMVGLGLAALSDSSSEAVVFEVQSLRAFHAAQSGLELGLNRLLPPGAAERDCSEGFFSTLPSVSFSVGGLAQCQATVTCRVDVSGSDRHYVLTSRGRCGAGPDLAERVVEAGIH